MAKKGLNIKQKVLLISVLVGVLLVGAIVSVVLVFAAENQKTTSSINVGFVASDVAGTVKFSHKLGTGEFSEPQVLSFDGTETTTTAAFGSGVDLQFTRENYYAVFKWEITGYSESGYHVSMQYLDQLAADKNIKFEYAIAASELANFDGLGLTAPVGTLVANSAHLDGERVILYVKASVNDIVKTMSVDGDFELVLSRESWTDPNFDSSTGISYGRVDNNGDPYAVAVGYRGGATEVNINTTSVYGVAMPVRTIADWAFANSQAMASSTALTKLTVGESVHTISGYAFANNTSLAEVTLAKNVSYVAKTAFYGCSGLNKFTNNSMLVEIKKNSYSLPTNIDLFNTPRIKVEDKQFNGRNYYYVEMGEYPQSFAGYETGVGAVSGLTASPIGETFVIDWYDQINFVYVQDKALPVFVDASGNRYVKNTIKRAQSLYYFSHNMNNENYYVREEAAYFKIEPIKWDVYGYYTDDSKANFIKVGTSEFETAFENNQLTQNIVVWSRFGLQQMVWHETKVNVPYNNSVIHDWLGGFYDRVLKSDYANMIEAVENGFGTQGATVVEYAWLPSINDLNDVLIKNDQTERRSPPTDFAISTSAYVNYKTEYGNITYQNGGSISYWLRTYETTYNTTYSHIVYDSGNMSNTSVNNTGTTARPALLINL